ncbi:MAG: hypothetical protein ACYC61_11890 [Isosphaeraceae bacterium]
MIAQIVVLIILGQADGSGPDATALLERLGSAKMAEQEAVRSLEALGPKALPALRAALRSKDPQLRSRARAIIHTIEGGLLTRESMVRLDFQDATLGDVARSIREQVGFEVGLGAQGPRAGTPRITIHEREPISFWDAVERLCEAGPVVVDWQIGAFRAGGVQPSLVLMYRPDPVIPPSSNHGPFHVTVESLLFRSHVSYEAFARPSGLILPKAAGPPARPEPAGPDRAGPSPGTPRPGRVVQFQVHLRVTPEPRMTIRHVGLVRLTEADDELGQSLLPPAAGSSPLLFGGMVTAMPNPYMRGGATNLTANLHRPERPGKLIKVLKGSVDVTVSAPRSNPLVIPIEGAGGKTFENDDWRIAVKSVDRVAGGRQTVIELRADDLETAAGAQDSARPSAPALGPFGRASASPLDPDGLGLSIQALTTDGRNTSYHASVSGGTGGITLRVNTLPHQGELKELRISGRISASATVRFAFRDLPMP